MIATARDGETLDALAWRVIGKTAIVTEAIFDANPGLAALGPNLPGGTQVDLTAALALPAQQRTRETISLWD